MHNFNSFLLLKLKIAKLSFKVIFFTFLLEKRLLSLLPFLIFKKKEQ